MGLKLACIAITITQCESGSILSLQPGAHRLAVGEQPANIITDEGADGDVTGAAHAPAPPIAGLEHLQGQLQALGHHPVPLLLAVMLGLTGGRRRSTLQTSIH